MYLYYHQYNVNFDWCRKVPYSRNHACSCTRMSINVRGVNPGNRMQSAAPRFACGNCDRALRPAAPDGGDGGTRKEYGRNRVQGMALNCRSAPHLRVLGRHRAQTAGEGGRAFARMRMREKRARGAPHTVSSSQKSQNLGKPCLSEPSQPIWVLQHPAYAAKMGSADARGVQ